MGKLKSLATRSITGAAYVGVILGSLFWGKVEVLAWILALFAMLGVYEYQTMMKSNQYALFLKIWHSLMAGLPIYIAYEWRCGGEVYMAALPLVVYYLFYLIGEIYRIKRQPGVELGHAFFSHFYVTVPMIFLLLAATEEHFRWGTLILLPIFITIWLNDTGAYLVGSLIGKHKMIQRVSPNKTWEGTIGGAVVALIGTTAFVHLLGVGRFGLELVGFVLIVVFFSTFGDLFESFLKRSCGVKDSGKILPGHGGILDRIDSLLFVAVPAYFYLSFLIM